MLTIFQTLGQWKTKDAKLVPYHEYLEGLTESFEYISFTYTPRMKNQFADALATLASMMLPYALLAYRTSIRTFTGATPYSLVYGMEAVLPIEVEIPSMRILAETVLEEAEWAKQRYEQLNLIDERRLKALCHGQCYQ
ncbi:hypothetical protein CRG98_021229 [Punica granatum]|uniref:RNase H type-1 domain-containing protein n=1 Tax=Punica granatum TaxID=22663 RepID=A0A2I0JPY2_PUNGR|nr:hypothetical protein CRG98_021229 [Punica granatum]